MHTAPPPEAIDRDASTTGLRAVAIFEAVKGTGVLLIGLGLLTLLHKDVEEIAEQVLVNLHISPERGLSRAVLRAASHMTDAKLWGFAAVSMAYAVVRFTEAWGLWYKRVWAEWFALLSGALYLPWEIIKVLEKPNLLHWGVLFGNVLIVLYMLYIRVRAQTKVVDIAETK